MLHPGTTSQDKKGPTRKVYLCLPGLVEELLMNSTDEVSVRTLPLHHQGAGNVVESVFFLVCRHGYSGQEGSFSGPPGELWLWVPAFSPAAQNQDLTLDFLQGYDWGGGCTWG